MRLLTTTFFVYDTGNEIIYPNADLTTKSIVNLDATKNMSDSVEFSLPMDTPEELMLDLQIRIKKYSVIPEFLCYMYKWVLLPELNAFAGH